MDLLSFIGKLLAVVIPSVTLVFTALVFYRDKRIQVENHLYERKLEVYNKILGELDHLLWFCNDHYLDLKHDNLSKEDQEKIADKVDEAIYDFDNFYISQSLYLSDQMDDSIHDITEMLLNSDEITLDEWKPYFDKLIAKANLLAIEMREELQLDNLNTSLFERLRRD